jgi:hypothetical protein
VVIGVAGIPTGRDHGGPITVPAPTFAGTSAMMRPLLLLAFLTWASTSGADTLLGSFQFFTGSGGDAAVSSVQSISLELGYDSNPSTPPCVSMRVGCEPVPVANLAAGAVFTYDAGHGAHFSDVAGYLTNGVDEPMWFTERAWSARGTILAGGSATPRLESALFHLPADIHTYTITRITQTIDSFALGDQSLCGSTAPGFCFLVTSTWRIYGERVATPALPSSWGLLKATYR